MSDSFRARLNNVPKKVDDLVIDVRKKFRAGKITQEEYHQFCSGLIHGMILHFADEFPDPELGLEVVHEIISRPETLRALQDKMHQSRPTKH